MAQRIYAHFRPATREEYDRLFRPLVCVVGEQRFYTYHSARLELEQVITGLKVRPQGDYAHHAYEFPDGTTLDVRLVEGRWHFDGLAVRETWPIATRRDWVCGQKVFRVKPEDDTILFDVTDRTLDWADVAIGMQLLVGTPGTGPD